ncbi:hypothetical protein L1887_42103 [Cichorium endivia]|nr:hypothetical protein L1887_42103 [Cichorium endivia]
MLAGDLARRGVHPDGAGAGLSGDAHLDEAGVAQARCTADLRRVGAARVGLLERGDEVALDVGVFARGGEAHVDVLDHVAERLDPLARVRQQARVDGGRQMALVAIAVLEARELHDGALRLDEGSRGSVLGSLLRRKELVQAELEGLGDGEADLAPTAAVLGMLPHGEDGERLDDLELRRDVVGCDAREGGFEELERVEVALDLDELGRDGADGGEEDAVVGAGLERLERVDVRVEQRDDGVEAVVVEAHQLAHLVLVEESGRDDGFDERTACRGGGDLDRRLLLDVRVEGGREERLGGGALGAGGVEQALHGEGVGGGGGGAVGVVVGAGAGGLARVRLWRGSDRSGGGGLGTLALELDAAMVRGDDALDAETDASCAGVGGGVVGEDAARLDLAASCAGPPLGKRRELLLGDDVALCGRHGGDPRVATAWFGG